MIRLIVILLFLLSPLLSNIAASPSLSWGDISVVLFVFWFLAFRGRIGLNSLAALNVVVPLAIFVFLYYSLFTEVSFLPALRMLFYVFCLIVLLDLCRSKTLVKEVALSYMRISIVFSFLLILQVLLYKIFGFVLIYMETPYDIEVNSVRSLGVDAYGMRTGGVFKEPSYYVLFMLPALFYAASSKRLALWLFYSVSVVLSTSALGFLFVFMTFFRFFPRRLVFIAPALSLSFMVLVFFYSLNFLPVRVMDTIGGEGSLAVRLYDPFVYLYSNISNFIFPGLDRLDSQAVGWLNSLSYMFVLFGVSAGLLVLLVVLCCGKVAWVALLLLFLTNSLSGPYFLVVMVLLKLFSDPAADFTLVMRSFLERVSVTRRSLKFC